MILKNPPVIESWIGFRFEPAEHARPWDIQAADKFLSCFESTFPHREAFFRTQFEIQEISPSRRPRIVSRETQLEKVRARNEEGTAWLQVAEDLMVYNRTRGDGTYHGFASLRDEALSKLSEYVAFFQPIRLQSAQLHYVDVIKIPIPADKKLELDECFNLHVTVPSQFGDTLYFETRLLLQPPNEADTLEVRFKSEPPSEDPAAYRFRLNWHMSCASLGGFDPEVVKGRLDQAHEYLISSFKASVTERTWSLFEPSEEG